MLELAHRLSARLLGLMKRVYHQMVACNFGFQEWAEFLSLAGFQGSSGAQVANRQTFVSQRFSRQKAFFLVCQDFAEMVLFWTTRGVKRRD